MTSFTATDHALMAEAVRLARRGLWNTAPNPRVGCVIAHGDRIVGRGWHERAGGPHAEVGALREAGGEARGACAYVTLEPCSHHGRTPPCADALIKAGVARVVAAVGDPHPEVNGGGLSRLREAGIEVAAGLLERSARALNPGFFSRIERGRPWLRLKLAGSLDGYAVGPDGESQWITGPEARRDGHRWRARADTILTGIGTVIADNPGMDVRLDGFEAARRVVVADSNGRLDASSKIFTTASEVIQAVADEDAGRASGARRLVVGRAPGGGIRLDALVAELAAMEANEVHVEAGPALSGALLVSGLVDEVIVYQAACLIGSEGGALARLPGVEKLAQRLHFAVLETRRVGIDWRLRLQPQPASVA